MECGFVRDHGEVVEAVAVQMVAASVKLDAGSAPPVFYAAQAASNKAVDLETLKTGGRFDSRLVLQRLLDQPVSSTPNEFDPSRKIVKSFVDDLSRYRKSWK